MIENEDKWIYYNLERKYLKNLHIFENMNLKILSTLNKYLRLYY